MSDLVNLADLDIDGQSEQPLWKVKVGDYTYYLYSDRRADVHKGDSQTATYTIGEHGCNCPSRMYRAMACKHEKVLEWTGDGAHDEAEEVIDADWLS